MSEKPDTTPNRREASDQQVTDFLNSPMGSKVMAGILILLVVSFILSAVL